jgi:hypothetical protein
MTPRLAIELIFEICRLLPPLGTDAAAEGEEQS